MRYNEPTWLFKNDYMSFFPKNLFHMNEFWNFFLQLVIINVYNCPGTWHNFFSSFLNKYEFLKVS